MNSTFPYSRLAALLLPAVLLVAAPQGLPPSPTQPPPPSPTQVPLPPGEEDSYQGEAPERYAMVRAVEGEVHIRKGDLDEFLSRGTPIAEGDVVESRGRGVLQLGDGTRVAFGGATRFTVATLFTDRKGEKQVLLRLDYGRLRVLLGGQTDARFRVDTQSGSVTCFDKGAFSIEGERDRIVRLKVVSGRVSFANDRDEARITAGERLTVYSPQDGLDRVRGFNTYDGDDFDHWSDRAVVVQRGESWDRVPTELRYYADELDNHGRWLHSDEFGDVWQPAGVAEDWRPYYDGRWAPYPGGMTWVSDEPWAYVAYHHGRWHWALGRGRGLVLDPGSQLQPGLGGLELHARLLRLGAPRLLQHPLPLGLWRLGWWLRLERGVHQLHQCAERPHPHLRRCAPHPHLQRRARDGSRPPRPLATLSVDGLEQ